MNLSVSLSRIDMKTGAVKDLNKALLTNIKLGRETGKDNQAALLGSYAEGLSAIDRDQAKLDIGTRNTEATLNLEAGMKADVINAAQRSKDAETMFKLSGVKAGMKGQSFTDLKVSIANIANMKSRNVANKFTAAAGLKPYIDLETAGLNARIDKRVKRQDKVDVLEDASLDELRGVDPYGITKTTKGLFNIDQRYPASGIIDFDPDMGDEFIPDFPDDPEKIRRREELEMAEFEDITNLRKERMDVGEITAGPYAPYTGPDDFYFEDEPNVPSVIPNKLPPQTLPEVNITGKRGSQILPEVEITGKQSQTLPETEITANRTFNLPGVRRNVPYNELSETEKAKVDRHYESLVAGRSVKPSLY